MGTRHPFGGGIADWVFAPDSNHVPVLSAGAAITAWSSQQGGTQITNLSVDPAGATPVTGVLTSDGTDGYAYGEIPIFYGPEDVTVLWLSADGGPRTAVGSIDSAGLAGAVSTQLAQHVSAVNPHQTRLGDLADTSFPSTLPAGAVPVWNVTTQLWEISTASGLNPNLFVQVGGGSVVRVPEADVVTVGQEWRSPAGDRSAAPNLWQASWNSGSAGVPAWALAAYLNGYGELRARSPRDLGIPFRIERRSSGATGDLFQVVNEVGAVLAWINSKGHLRAPNLGRSIPFTAVGTLTANPGKFVWFNDTGADLVLRSIRFWLDTVGTTTSTFDVNDNGTTLYPSGKPSLASGVQTVQLSTAFTIVAGHRITIDVDAAGTGAKDLTAQLELW